MATTDTMTDGTAPRRRRARLLSLLVTVLAVGVGAFIALRRRTPALPAFPQESEPGPSTTARPAPAVPPTPRTPAEHPPAQLGEPGEPAEPGQPVDPEPVVPASPDEPAHPPTSSTTAVAELQRVSGIGRRSAEALVAAGIDSLDRLAGADTDALAAALEAAGLPRSATLSAWAPQARRLTQA